MRELNVNEIKDVNGGANIFSDLWDWATGGGVDAGVREIPNTIGYEEERYITFNWSWNF
jgi:hypothetical protein